MSDFDPAQNNNYKMPYPDQNQQLPAGGQFANEMNKPIPPSTGLPKTIVPVLINYKVILCALDLLVLPLLYYVILGLYKCFLFFCASFHSMLLALIIIVAQIIFHCRFWRKFAKNQMASGAYPAQTAGSASSRFYILAVLMLLAIIIEYIYKAYFYIY